MILQEDNVSWVSRETFFFSFYRTMLASHLWPLDALPPTTTSITTQCVCSAIAWKQTPPFLTSLKFYRWARKEFYCIMFVIYCVCNTYLQMYTIPVCVVTESFVNFHWKSDLGFLTDKIEAVRARHTIIWTGQDYPTRTVQGGRRRGRQRKRWDGNIKEWTGLEWNIMLQKAENRKEWRKLVVQSTVVPQRSARLWDR